MDPPLQTPGSQFDPQLPFYGPGALATWYLSLLCVFLTWTYHPTKSFPHLRLTPDIAFYTLYACLASGHLAHQASQLSAAEIAQLREKGALGWSDARFEDRDVTEGMDAAMKARVAGMNVAMRVAVYFFWFGAGVLAAVGYGKRVWPGEMGQMRRREKGLPWMVVGAEVWIFGCFGWVAGRCGFWIMVSAFLQDSIVNGFMVVGSGMLAFISFVVMWTVWIVGRDEFGPDVRRFWDEARVKGVNYPRLVALLRTALIGLFYGLWEAVVLAMLYWTVPLCLFPDVGVSVTGLDQILALCTGLVAVAFTTSSIVQVEFDDWESFCVWVRRGLGMERSSGRSRKQPKVSSPVQRAGYKFGAFQSRH